MEWIYSNNADNSARYILGTRGKKTLFCCGINPSTAEPDDLDNTAKKVEKIALNNGYDSWVMFNVYPKRSTIFEQLSDECNNLEHIENIKQIQETLKKYSHIDIWVAFGDKIYEKKFLKNCWLDIYEHIKDFNINWLATGINKTGTPKHPLYQKDISTLSSYDMKNFIETL